MEVKHDARIFDIGCGSGILGLAAALHNNATVFACDINLRAIKASVQNAASNRMKDKLRLFCGSPDAVNADFEIVLANLPAAVHMELFDHYRRLTHSCGGMLVVSGFSDVNAVHIENEIVGRGFMVVDRVTVNAWAAATTPEYSFTWVGLGLKRIDQ